VFNHGCPFGCRSSQVIPAVLLPEDFGTASSNPVGRSGKPWKVQQVVEFQRQDRLRCSQSSESVERCCPWRQYRRIGSTVRLALTAFTHAVVLMIPHSPVAGPSSPQSRPLRRNHPLKPRCHPRNTRPSWLVLGGKWTDISGSRIDRTRRRLPQHPPCRASETTRPNRAGSAPRFSRAAPPKGPPGADLRYCPPKGYSRGHIGPSSPPAPHVRPIKRPCSISSSRIASSLARPAPRLSTTTPVLCAKAATLARCLPEIPATFKAAAVRDR